jgi:hypothetical protein
MDNFTKLRLFASMKMEWDIHLARCKMGDQQMAVLSLTSTPMGTNNM